MTVAIATPILNDGDAIGHDVLGMANALRADGHDVRFFAEKARVDEDVFPLADLADFLRHGDNAVIYHHSLRCDTAVRAVERYPHQAVVKFHNVTPPRFFTDVNPEAVPDCEVGRQQAIRLARSGVPFWVDSAFNARDLADDVPTLRSEELPPFHQAETLLRTTPDADNLGGLDNWAPTLLCVGRVAPNKNLELAVETLAELRDPHARLVLAGEHVYADYSDRVLKRAESLGVAGSLVVTGHVSTAQLKALYLASDLLLVTSDHEGFCVPLVEAMVLGVPIVGVPRTAVPDTGGDAVRYANDAPTLANAVREVIDDSPTRERHLRAGRRRYRERFSQTAIAARFRELFARQFAACAV
ncbi:glycosyltransferase [Limnoglobus roseus]|uniref:GT4 family glycosyltransferase n=1 Tax=Limnoglobus roseus TaxID=2598579 RepID=A0A5C1ABC3_9BACT|nr:glycosyltransferase [Limnoglobus roseus]QEL15316.1 GT4 family glycosyltransferase [Limnoglobus roseus]